MFYKLYFIKLFQTIPNTFFFFFNETVEFSFKSMMIKIVIKCTYAIIFRWKNSIGEKSTYKKNVQYFHIDLPVKHEYIYYILFITLLSISNIIYTSSASLALCYKSSRYKALQLTHLLDAVTVHNTVKNINLNTPLSRQRTTLIYLIRIIRK